jgi:spore coat polysaccharide biosynthesis protein SpsF (cytidylyltransferase family)
LTNPYRILDLSYWDYSNRDKKHVPQEGAVFVKQTEEKEINEENGEVVITTQTDYILLEKFPNYTNQTQIYLRADDILTICDPSNLVLECYEKTLG